MIKNILDLFFCGFFLKKINQLIVWKVNKVINNRFYDEIRDNWIYGNDDLVLRKMNSKYACKFMWKDLDHEIWLIYLSSLLNLNKLDQMDYVLRTYLAKYNSNEEIKNYLPLSSFLYEKKIHDYKDSFDIFKYLTKNRKNLTNLLLNAKTIAIVGNGSSHLGKGVGSQIDEHDLVIRFNNFKTDGFELDYGKKTDIWVRGSAKDIVEPYNFKDIKFIVWAVDYKHFKVPFDHFEKMVKYKDEKILFTNLDYDVHRDVKLRSGIIFPTTGLLLIWYTYLVCKSLDKVSLYGFGFQSENVSEFNEHYFEKRDIKKASSIASVHDMYLESEFISNLFS